MAKKARVKHTFIITYFTMKGKAFMSKVYEYEARENKHGNPMKSIAAHIRGLANQDSQGGSGLPGLGEDYWQGPILIEHEHYASRLVMPEKRGKGFRIKGLKEAFA